MCTSNGKFLLSSAMCLPLSLDHIMQNILLMRKLINSETHAISTWQNQLDHLFTSAAPARLLNMQTHRVPSVTPPIPNLLTCCNFPKQTVENEMKPPHLRKLSSTAHNHCATFRFHMKWLTLQGRLYRDFRLPP